MAAPGVAARVGEPVVVPEPVLAVGAREHAAAVRHGAVAGA
jgi:hypothetical protein